MSEQHLSPEELTAMVGGNPPSPDQKAHLLACEACRGSLLQAPALEQEADRLLFLGADAVRPARFKLKEPEPWGRNIALAVAAGVAAWLFLPLPKALEDQDEPVAVTAELAEGPGDAVVVKYTANATSSGRLFVEQGGGLQPLLPVTLQAGAHELQLAALPQGRIYLAVRARGGPPDWDSSLSDLRAQSTVVTLDPRPRTSTH